MSSTPPAILGLNFPASVVYKYMVGIRLVSFILARCVFGWVRARQS